MSEQDCCNSKNVLCIADMQATISSVTSSWGSTKEAVVTSDSRGAETVQRCDYYLHLWHYYFTYFRNYTTRICNSAWRSLKKRGQRYSPSHGIRVSSKQKHKRLNQGPQWPRCPAPRAGRQLGRCRPGRPFECRQAIRRAWQDETDPPIHQRFRQ